MSFHVWMSFFVLCWGMSLSPGPAQLASLSASLNYGWKRSIPQTFGLACGVFFLIMLVGLGVGALLAASPKAFFIVRTLGCAYLAWIGISLLRAKAETVVIRADGKAPEESALQLWWRGFLVNATNPKGIVFFLSLLTPFLDTSAPVLPQYAVMGLTCGFTDACVMTAVTLLAEAVSKKLRSARNVILVNRIFGVVFLAIAAGLFFFEL